jgi:hypothetical protein
MVTLIVWNGKFDDLSHGCIHLFIDSKKCLWTILGLKPLATQGRCARLLLTQSFQAGQCVLL